MLGCKLVTCIKFHGTGKEILKAILILQGHKEFMKSSLVQKISVARQYEIKMLVVIAMTFLFLIFSTYITRTHLQRDE